jgi:hypothetical protein
VLSVISSCQEALPSNVLSGLGFTFLAVHAHNRSPTRGNGRIGCVHDDLQALPVTQRRYRFRSSWYTRLLYHPPE